MTITSELQELVKKHLPAIQAEELKTFIEQAQKDSNEIVALKKKNEENQKTIADLKAMEKDLNEAKSIRNKGEADIELAKEKERNLTIESLKIKLQAEERVTNSMREFICLIAKNPRAIEIMSHFQGENQGSYYNGNNFVTPTPIIRNETKITESKETKDDTNI